MHRLKPASASAQGSQTSWAPSLEAAATVQRSAKDIAAEAIAEQAGELAEMVCVDPARRWSRHAQHQVQVYKRVATPRQAGRPIGRV